MNRLEWVLGIFLALLLLIVAGLSLMFWFQPSEPATTTQSAETSGLIDFNEAAPTSVYEGATAQLAYAAAQQTAVSWQPDAVLLSTSGDWPHGVSPQTVDSGATNWIFTFYSPATGKVTSITVIENEAKQLSSGEYKPQNNLVEAGSWKIDSNHAMQTFLAEGGSDFIRREGATTVNINFTTDNPNQQIIWNIVAFAPNTSNLFSIQIDANSGQIIESTSIP